MILLYCSYPLSGVSIGIEVQCSEFLLDTAATLYYLDSMLFLTPLLLFHMYVTSRSILYITALTQQFYQNSTIYSTT